MRCGIPSHPAHHDHLHHKKNNMSTNIQWTDVTDNIIRVNGGGWWCRKISPGCANCYAAKLNMNAFYGGNKLAYTGAAPELELQTGILERWARQTKPKRHFVASMTDIFGDWVPREWIFKFLDRMAYASKQTFQLLTKRPDIAAAHIAEWINLRDCDTLPVNIWIGTSVEDQTRADERIPVLLKIPAKVRFLSVEPLLGAVDIRFAMHRNPEARVCPKCMYATNRTHEVSCPNDGEDLGPDIAVEWVIVGGESGPKARPCNVAWIRSIVEQCKAAGVPCFVKQLGSHATMNAMGVRAANGGGMQGPEQRLDRSDLVPVRLNFKHKKGGDPSEWPADLRVREFPVLEGVAR